MKMDSISGKHYPSGNGKGDGLCFNFIISQIILKNGNESITEELAIEVGETHTQGQVRRHRA
jgi:hypothetical protein